jgi:hypothetical protein
LASFPSHSNTLETARRRDDARAVVHQAISRRISSYGGLLPNAVLFKPGWPGRCSGNSSGRDSTTWAIVRIWPKSDYAAQLQRRANESHVLVTFHHNGTKSLNFHPPSQACFPPRPCACGSLGESQSSRRFLQVLAYTACLDNLDT